MVDRNKRIKINLQNTEYVSKGIYSNLKCPKCDMETAEVYFSKHRYRESYGVWFECQNCGNVEHMSCYEKPDGFTATRLSSKYQGLDERAWKAEDT